MKKYEALVPLGITIACLEDLGCMKVKDVKKILTIYNQKVFGGKADLILRVYTIFSHVTSHAACDSF